MGWAGRKGGTYRLGRETSWVGATLWVEQGVRNRERGFLGSGFRCCVGGGVDMGWVGEREEVRVRVWARRICIRCGAGLARMGRRFVPYCTWVER